MSSLAKIVVPVDFSERSADAVRYARPLAAQRRAELILLHVLTPLQYEFGALEIGGYMTADLYRTRSDQVAQELEGFLQAELQDISVRRVVLEGDPARCIVEFAHGQEAGVILMPTHGYGPFRRFILGSITAKVLHDADCPVWTGVHLEDAPAAGIPPRRILCAVDLSAQSSKVLCWAAGLALQFGAQLMLLHVTPPSAGADAAPFAEQARQELTRLLQFVRAEAEMSVECGEPPATICAAARRHHADILVIGRGSAAGVFGRLRANAYAIIRQSPCPVISV